MIAFIERLSTSRVYRCYFIYKANMENYKVYKHTFPNNKVYIGITKNNVSRRWINGNGYNSQYVYRAIKKYGWGNIKHEVLFENLTKEEAEQKEINLIAYYKSNQTQYGYNVSGGGNHAGIMAEKTKEKLRQIHKGKVLSETTKEKIRKARSRQIISEETKQKLRAKNLGKKLSEEHKNKIALANTGKKMSEETKQKIRKANLLENLSPEVLQRRREAQKRKTYRDSPETRKIKSEKMRCRNGKKILCVELNKEFGSIKEASRQLGLLRTSISSVCNGHAKSIKGYHFIKLN